MPLKFLLLCLELKKTTHFYIIYHWRLSTWTRSLKLFSLVSVQGRQICLLNIIGFVILFFFKCNTSYFQRLPVSVLPSMNLNILKIIASLIHYDVLLNTAMFLELNFALEKYAGATFVQKNLMSDFSEKIFW